MPGPAKRARAVDRGHAQNFHWRELWIVGRQLAHFFEHAEFGVLFPDFANGGQAVRAEADVDVGVGQPFAQKRRMAEIIMAARTMNNVNAMFAEQRGVPARQHVDVNGEQIFAEHFIAGEVFDRRAETAVGHVAGVALHPVEHFAARAHEHFKFLRGFRDMNAKLPAAFTGGTHAEAEQLRHGGVGGVRRKRGGTTRVRKRINFFDGFAKDCHRVAPGADAGHFEKRKDAQRRGVPNFRQKVGHGFDIRDGRRAGAREHPRAVQPGTHVIGIAPSGLGGKDEWNPVGEGFRRRQHPGHVGVVEVAMGVDKAGKQNDFAEIGNFPIRMRPQVRPGTNRANAISRNDHRAVFNGRLRDRQNRAGTENHGC